MQCGGDWGNIYFLKQLVSHEHSHSFWFFPIFHCHYHRFVLYSTHQLNVHCAAIGHPIVGDKVYGINGEAAANGGLAEGTLSSRASSELQESISGAIGDKSMCVHANTISFEHPVTGDKLSFESGAPF